MKLTQKQTDNFWSKVDVRGPDECWEWKPGGAASGYGTFSINHKTYSAHRIAFFLQYGHLPVPMGLHSCNNRTCVNPNHIHEGTGKDNADERQASGHTTTKLTADQVKEIRESNESQRKIAKQFGIQQHHVWAIKHRVFWKHI